MKKFLALFLLVCSTAFANADVVNDQASDIQTTTFDGLCAGATNVQACLDDLDNLSVTETDPLSIHTDGTSMTSQIIPFAQGLSTSLASGRLINSVTSGTDDAWWQLGTSSSHLKIAYRPSQTGDEAQFWNNQRKIMSFGATGTASNFWGNWNVKGDVNAQGGNFSNITLNAVSAPSAPSGATLTIDTNRSDFNSSIGSVTVRLFSIRATPNGTYIFSTTYNESNTITITQNSGIKLTYTKGANADGVVAMIKATGFGINFDQAVLFYNPMNFASLGAYAFDTVVYLRNLQTSMDTSATSYTGNIQLNNLTASKPVFTDASKNLTSTGIGTSSQFLKGNGSLDSSVYYKSGDSPTFATITGTNKMFIGPNSPANPATFSNTAVAFGTAGDTKLVIYTETPYTYSGGTALAFYFPNLSNAPYFEFQMVPSQTADWADAYMRYNLAGHLTGSPIAITDALDISGKGNMSLGGVPNSGYHAVIYGNKAWRSSSEGAAQVQLGIFGATGQTADLQNWSDANSTVLAKVDKKGLGTFNGLTLKNLPDATYADWGSGYASCWQAYNYSGAYAWSTTIYYKVYAKSSEGYWDITPQITNVYIDDQGMEENDNVNIELSASDADRFVIFRSLDGGSTYPDYKDTGTGMGGYYSAVDDGTGWTTGSFSVANPDPVYAYLTTFLQLPPLASAPSSPTEGMIYAKTDHHLYYYNGTTWKQLDN